MLEYRKPTKSDQSNPLDRAKGVRVYRGSRSSSVIRQQGEDRLGLQETELAGEGVSLPEISNRHWG